MADTPTPIPPNIAEMCVQFPLPASHTTEINYSLIVLVVPVPGHWYESFPVHHLVAWKCCRINDDAQPTYSCWRTSSIGVSSAPCPCSCVSLALFAAFLPFSILAKAPPPPISPTTLNGTCLLIPNLAQYSIANIDSKSVCNEGAVRSAYGDAWRRLRGKYTTQAMRREISRG